MHTEVCDRLGIEFPIFAFSHCRDVVAAVTNAGGFGVLGATGHSPRALETDLAWIDEQVKGKPYGVDLLLPVSYDKTAPQHGQPEPPAAPPPGGRFPPGHQAFLDDLLTRYDVPELPGHLPASAGALSVSPQAASSLLDVAFAHPIRLVASALGPPPADLVSQAHDRGVVVAALVGTAEHARRQQAAGVDLIVAQGTEAGGHTGQISTMVLVPEVVRTVAPVPVLAAGGIVTGAQMAAAMALGAQGVWCGSVWLTTEEAETDPSVKKKMLAASAADTVRSRSLTGKPARMLRSAWTDEWESDQAPAPLPMPLQTMLTASAQQRINRNAGAGGSGATELATYFVGQGVGLMDRIRPARQVVEQMVADYLAVAESFAAQLQV
ncbi:MAG TPA: nitronate monooxygenase [Streptosporangiaceae bacterium]|nr:nitronate monooxygenase [Streptosporangiaceae bacterium]